MARSGVELVLPSVCFVCGRVSAPRQHLGACLPCWTDLRPPRSPICPRCGEPASDVTDLLGPGEGLCGACVLRPRPLPPVRALLAYDGVARRFLLRAKLQARRELLPSLGLQLAAAAASWEPARSSTRIVAVPSHPMSWLIRGFHPARELAIPVARRLGAPLSRELRRRDALSPVRYKRLGARARRARVSGVFRSRRRLDGERVLLVDDVMTTGATLEACARILREAGADSVAALVWARTPRPGPAVVSPREVRL